MYAQSITNRTPAFYTALVIITLLPLYIASYRLRLWHNNGETDRTAIDASSASFIQDWLGVHVVQPFSPSAIAEYCERIEWHPNLVFNLAGDSVGDVRGHILDFLFNAIEAGASIVLPSTTMAADRRNASRIVVNTTTSFGMFFNETWFISSMAEACPQMAIYKPEQDHKMADALPGVYKPRSRRIDMDSGNTKKAYLEHLDAWLKEKPEFKPDELTLVNVERTKWQIDTRNLPQRFRRSFGQVLRTVGGARRLAAVAVQELSQKFSLHVDPRVAIPRRVFYGAHMDSNHSSTSESYANFSSQADAHFMEAVEMQLKIIFIASENATELALFKIWAAKHALPLIAVSKIDLLPPDELAALKQMTAAQQALVDFEILIRCSVFGGSIKSSSSYNIALTRNQWLADQGRINDPWFVVHEDVGMAFNDGVSRILGRDGVNEQQIPRGMWP